MIKIMRTAIVIVSIFSFFPPEPSASDKVKIAVSFYPLSFIAERVGGSHVEVINMTPAGVQPHEFEPTMKSIKTVYSSHLFLYNGAGFDSWAEKLAPELKKKGTVTVNMSSYMVLLNAWNDSGKADTKAHDPHFWLDPVLIKREVEVVRNALIKKDPANRADYEKNAASISTKFDELNNRYSLELKNCKHKDIVVSHSAFQYIAKRYGLNMFSILGVTASGEPSPKKLAELSRIVKEKNIKYVFYESLLSPKLAQTLSNEAGVKTLTLNTCEGLTDDDIKAGRNYLSLMEDNLKNLKTALQCN
ncbi:MAG: zinc ABC transporter substrate-binding protein [Nitrospirae bacterium YQR-1]